jgi:hypothetical protein
VILLGVALAAVAAGPAESQPQRAAGTLELRMTLGVVSDPVACPADIQPAEGRDCRARIGQRVVPGLGRVSETYIWAFRVGPPTCPLNLAKPLARAGTFSVAGKGEIVFVLADGARCVEGGCPCNEPQEFTLTGGTGPFAAASGKGTVERSLAGGRGTETWTGTLEVPGLTFDLIPPTLSGATAKTVRVPKKAKTARVTYRVTATDDVDGAVPIACQPRSGSRFKVARTTVRCEATDSSANTAKAAFTVTVKRRR